MDFYILLGIERGATLNDIKRAYKRLARRYHPDINPGDRTAAAQFRQIAEAYETLSDPDRRRRYDTGGLDRSQVDQTFGFEGFDFSVSVSGASAPTFGDLFADVLRQRQGARNDGVPERGAESRCLHCHGTGAVKSVRGHMIFSKPCAHCGGSGQQVPARCPACGGAQVEVRAEALTIQVPAGLADGARVRVAG